jgi:SAM-dependent methyltransferase
LHAHQAVGEDNVNAIARLTYPEFVAFMGQENTPPLGAETVRAWVEMARIDADAHVLDYACSTGFSSRTLVRLTGCRVTGIDLCSAAIEVATQFSVRDKVSHRSAYYCADGHRLPFNADHFTHVVAGACLGFVTDKPLAVREIARVLQPGGKLCVSTFYYPNGVAAEVLDRVEASVGFRPSSEWNYDYWRGLFAPGFELVSERHHDLPVLPARAVRDAAAHFVKYECLATRESDETVQLAVLRRLLVDRLVFNEHRAYQALTTQVWQKL